jgi:hypothetical protein
MSQASNDFEAASHVAKISDNPPQSIAEIYARMKRKPDEVTGTGKRQRVYQDGANIHHVDAEIFQQAGIQNDVNPELTDADDSEDLGNPLERLDEVELQRLEEERQHAIRAVMQAQVATITRTHTPGSRRISRVMRRQNITHQDMIDNLNDDDDGIRWRPCVSPDIDLLHRFIGKRVTNADCYGCTRGIGIERVGHKVLQDLCDFITEMIACTHPGEVCCMISEYFDFNIRDVYNENLAPGENAILPWDPYSIHEHIFYHMKEASFIHKDLISALHEHFRIVRYRSVYRTTVEAARSGRQLDIQDMHVVEKGHKPLMDSAKMLLLAMSKRPQEMSNFNPKFNVANAYTAAINPKRQQAPLEQTKTIYDNPDTGL